VKWQQKTGFDSRQYGEPCGGALEVATKTPSGGESNSL
jgi:hypothetical protein